MARNIGRIRPYSGSTEIVSAGINATPYSISCAEFRTQLEAKLRAAFLSNTNGDYAGPTATLTPQHLLTVLQP
jgi:hypothetical protein